MFHHKVEMFSLFLGLLTSYSHASQMSMNVPASGVAILVPGESLELECQLAEDKQSTFIWYKRELEAVEELPIIADSRTDIQNQSLVLNETNLSDLGDYRCVTYSNKTEASTLIKVRLEPRLGDLGFATSHLGNSSIVYEGQRVEMLCGPTEASFELFSYWRRSPSPRDAFTANSERIDIVNKETDLSNLTVYSIDLGNCTSRLVIESVSMDDRAYYYCIVRSNKWKGKLMRRVLLRVRSRLALYWPLGGILIEALAIVYFIYWATVQRKWNERTLPNKIIC